MSVEQVTVAAGDGEVRLDRWFKRRYPELAHARLEKLLRTGQVRVDGKRATAGQRLAPGQIIRVPPLGLEHAPARPPKPAPRRLGPDDERFARALVIHRDNDVIAINKPASLAVQGGTGTSRHLDAMLDALRFDALERPRLVHRLDRDTSGVLLLARHSRAAAHLAEAFRHKTTRKLYWALVAGTPRPARGRIDLALAKIGGPQGERVAGDEDEGKRAVTLYDTVEVAAPRVAWLVMWPLTGRTHQLRVHAAAALETPVVGDFKYGGAAARIDGDALEAKLHLHARSIAVPHPAGGVLRVHAKLPPHMRAAWGFFGFDPEADPDPFPTE